MPAELAEAGLAAVLESRPGAGAQGVHCDSLKPGATGITSYEQDQYVYILFFAFHAMRILQELRKDRLAATEHIRSRLAATGVCFSDKEWTDVAEEGIWQFLVHEQFRVRRFLFTNSSEFHSKLYVSLFARITPLPWTRAARMQARHGLAFVVRTEATSMAMSVRSGSWLRTR